MQATNKIAEFQSILSKMPLEVCIRSILPELHVKWSEVSRAVRKARLPMTSPSVARVLAKHVARSLSDEEVDDIVASLRLKNVASQSRVWHLIRLEDLQNVESVATMSRSLPARITQSVRRSKASKNARTEVHSLFMNDVMYISVSLVSPTKERTLYIAFPLEENRALVSTLSMTTLLQACVEGIGYRTFEDASLFGRDINSLLRINQCGYSENVDHLAGIPEYNPIPIVTKTGVDYTYKAYNELYIDNVIGPNPPLLTDLQIKTEKSFFDRSRLDMKMKLGIHIKSEDVGKTLKSWVAMGALEPTSEFFNILHQLKSNKISYNTED